MKRRIDKKLEEEVKNFPYPVSFEYDRKRRVWRAVINNEEIYFATAEDIYTTLKLIKKLCQEK